VIKVIAILALAGRPAFVAGRKTIAIPFATLGQLAAASGFFLFVLAFLRFGVRTADAPAIFSTGSSIRKTATVLFLTSMDNIGYLDCLQLQVFSRVFPRILGFF
jgi:hypothetical protein